MSLLPASVALVFLALVRVAPAAPTVEEKALATVLQGESRLAVNQLERAADEDPEFRWLAGRVALEAEHLSLAERLFSGDTPSDRWGRVAVALARGQEAEASSAALEEMDAALQGEHREVLGRMLLEEATSRVDDDSQTATRLLHALLELGASEALDRQAEDALFRLHAGAPGQDLAFRARRRLAQAQGEVSREPLAARVVAASLGTTAPHIAFRLLEEVVREGGDALTEQDVLDAARRAVALSVPPAWRWSLLQACAERYPESEPVARLRLDHARQMMSRDPAMGEMAFEALVDDPRVGAEALSAWAGLTEDPVRARELWLRLAEREGGSARGERAREQALAALVRSVTLIEDPDDRRAAAQSALDQPGASLSALLHFHALPRDDERGSHLWDLAARFPGGGPWCEELASTLLDAGAGWSATQRYAELCSATNTREARVLLQADPEAPVLSLLPEDGGLDVLVAGQGEVAVSQHGVDPEVRYRAVSGNPLDAELDAFLVEPDREWEQALLPEEGEEEGAWVARRLRVEARGRDSLAALTLRVGDKRATALVVPEPLEIQAVGGQGTLAVAVLQEDDPVSGARLWVQDATGEVRTLRTGSEGMARLQDVSGTQRILARKGIGVGYAHVQNVTRAATAPERQVSVVLEDRALPRDGARAGIRVFGTTPEGDLEATVRVISVNTRGETVEERALPLEGGTAHTSLWLQGGGNVQVLDDEGELLVQESVPSAQDGVAPVAVVFSSALPRPGEPLSVGIHPTAHPIPAEGLGLRVSIWTPWGQREQEHVLHGEGLEIPFDLTVAAPGDTVQVTVALAAYPEVSSRVVVAGEMGSPVDVPARGVVGEPIAVEARAGEWLVARRHGGTLQHWVAPGEPLVLSAPGTWAVRAWRGGHTGTAEEVHVVSGEDLLSKTGTWTGSEPVMALVMAETPGEPFWIRTGDPLPTEAPLPEDQAWLRLADDRVPPLPLRTPPPPPLELSGEPRRGAATVWTLGEGLPEGTRLYAFLRDRSDGPRLPTAAPLQRRRYGSRGEIQRSWWPSAIAGQQIAAALLAEEERLREQQAPQRVRIGSRSRKEKATISEMSASAGGYGSGAGGYGRGRGSGLGSARMPAGGARPHWDPRSLGTWQGTAGETWQVELPSWITAVEIRLAARLPDGRWLSRTESRAVGGGAPTARPEPIPEPVADRWDGGSETLVEIALGLPRQARRRALAGLVRAGVQDASAPLRATPRVEQGPGAAIISALELGPVPDAAQALRRLGGLPDPRRVERVRAILEAAAGAPDRARAAALRLVEEDPDPWVRARAGLALWVAGAPQEALASLAGEDVLLAAARAVVSQQPEPAWRARLWGVARSAGADPEDRALAIQALALDLGDAEQAPAHDDSPQELALTVQPPVAAWRGEVFPRGQRHTTAREPLLELPAVEAVPQGHVFSLEVRLPASPLPGRVHCPRSSQVRPAYDWFETGNTRLPILVTCELTALEEGEATLPVRWYGPRGDLRGKGEVTVQITAPRPFSAEDPMSPDERYALGRAWAHASDPDPARLAAARDLLEELLAQPWLGAAAVRGASESLLAIARHEAEPEPLVRAFEAARERAPDSALDLETAAAVARAYSRLEAHERAVRAARVVMEARFIEELAAIQQVQAAGLALTALELLDTVVARYPETATVARSRYLAPSMLLQRASSDGDRLGFTRSSLRHTAAARLARFLLLHGDHDDATSAAELLLDTLQRLRDPRRQAALARPLADRYGHREGGWRLSLAHVRALFAQGRFRAALNALDPLEDRPEAASMVALEQGRALEALGRHEQAAEAYRRSGETEARARLAWLERAQVYWPPLSTLAPGQEAALPAEVREGARVSLVAYRIALESLLLRDGGIPRPDQVRVDGLEPAVNTEVVVGADGDLPLPPMPEGAYLLAASLEGQTWKTVLLRSGAELSVIGGPAGGTLVSLVDDRGRPVADAPLWFFDNQHNSRNARTDAAGHARLPEGMGTLYALARVGEGYAWFAPKDPSTGLPATPRSRITFSEGDVAPATKDLIRQNANEYGDLFRQERKQAVSLEAL